MLSDNTDGRKYWNKLKQRLKQEGNETVTNCHLLKLLAEATTTELSKAAAPKSFNENVEIARQGGGIAGNARKEIENKSGRSVITSQNAVELNQVVVDLIEDITDNNHKQKG